MNSFVSRHFYYLKKIIKDSTFLPLIDKHKITPWIDNTLLLVFLEI